MYGRPFYVGCKCCTSFKRGNECFRVDYPNSTFVKVHSFHGICFIFDILFVIQYSNVSSLNLSRAVACKIYKNLNDDCSLLVGQFEKFPLKSNLYGNLITPTRKLECVILGNDLDFVLGFYETVKIIYKSMHSTNTC